MTVSKPPPAGQRRMVDAVLADFGLRLTHSAGLVQADDAGRTLMSRAEQLMNLALERQGLLTRSYCCTSYYYVVPTSTYTLSQTTATAAKLYSPFPLQ